MKRVNLLFIVLILAFLGTTNSNASMLETNTSILRNLQEPLEATFAISANDGPTIGEPSLNNTSPNSDQAVNITVPINDEDGVQNATLFWEYTVNGTSFNSTINGTTRSIIVSEIDFAFQDTGFITETGIRTDSPSKYRYGDYLFNTSDVSEIDLTVVSEGLTRLVYVLIKAKNTTSGIWHTVFEVGAYGETTDLDDVNFTSTIPTSGYMVHAVTFRDVVQPPPYPEFAYFSFLNIYRHQCNWVIPAANKATFVDYYITSFDDLNQSSTSPTYNFLMDFAPDVNFPDSSGQTVKPKENYVLNVSVTDNDGEGTINTSSGVAYYRLQGEINWTVLALNYVDEFAGEQLFRAIIPLSNLTNIENWVTIRANVSDIVEGKMGRVGVSGTHWVFIDSLIPRVTTIDIDGGVDDISIPPPVPLIIENVTLTDVPVNITASFHDDRGIRSVSIYYSLPNGTTPVKLEMVNTTMTGETIDD
ncbi:MAG: hypothetical protein JSV04_01570, partial [Candidatus Heimdallarchaeota archaeon]